jgi:ElaA protein
MNMDWEWLSFNELGVDRLYEILAARNRVFVVEQKCFYQDADGLDVQAMHLLGRERGQTGGVIAYLRVLPPGLNTPGAPSIKYREHSMGRVLTLPEARGKGVGRQLMIQGLKRIQASYGDVAVRLSAQSYLEAFYKAFGFTRTTEPYLDAGIPHVGMLKRS